MYLDENDYDTEDENDYNDFNNDIYNEYNYYYKLKVISYYKNLLYHEPEFIGIKNISCNNILNIIETTNIPHKLFQKNHRLTNDQIMIYNNMYRDLFNKISDEDIYNSVTKQIFDKIYIY